MLLVLQFVMSVAVVIAPRDFIQRDKSPSKSPASHSSSSMPEALLENYSFLVHFLCHFFPVKTDTLLRI